MKTTTKLMYKGPKRISSGTVLWFNLHLGYGFIESFDGLPIFVHNSAIPKNKYNLRELIRGKKVKYTWEKTGKGLKVISILE